jgi:hypothetical protein
VEFKPEILQAFSIFLSEKMSMMNPDDEVPDHFIENELKQYINDNYKIGPELHQQFYLKQTNSFFYI